ncbi:MAG: UV DNA damage repair endonuclease UvsE [Candidatus Omnitrophica bacterium]|nr:UV DNA damage repair endonuclease UvsE [Candidatus Omnitrophota bacterium]
MKIGYVCVNTSLKCKPNVKFRLASYTPAKFEETVAGNLACLQSVLEWNLKHGLMFFRISSDTVPFASHPVCKIDWVKEFKSQLAAIGAFANKHSMRISMHPDQFVVINSPDAAIVERSVAELKYHADFLDALGLDSAAKIQIHVGGVYGNKTAAIASFIQAAVKLPYHIRRRLVIENDDKSYSLRDCLVIHQKTGMPILFDNFHHDCLNNGEPLKDAMQAAIATWTKTDGGMMLDYSSQQRDAIKGTHIDSIDIVDFERFLGETTAFDFDIMLEIRDKEKSAFQALDIIRKVRH